MAKLDRLGWAAGLGAEAFGVRIGLRTNEPEVLARLARVLPAGSQPWSGPIVDRLFSVIVGASGTRRLQRFNLLYVDSAQRARTLDLEELIRTFQDELELYVAETARERVFVHAGVVGWKDRAILLPGASLAGKSTLVAALVRAGASYYSDEYAVLDRRGRVHPYLRPLRSRLGDGTIANLVAADLGGREGAKPLRVGLVAVVSYRAGARWRPRPLSGGQALLELLACTVPVRARPRAALTALKCVVAGAPILKSRRGEAEETARTLLSLCAEAPRRGQGPRIERRQPDRERRRGPRARESASGR